MFKLEQSISEWRRQMLAAGIKTPVPLDELENHLRDHIEQQMRAGAIAREAFEAGVARIGPTDGLQTEFVKIGRTGTIRQFMQNKLAVAIGVFGLICTVVGAYRYWITFYVSIRLIGIVHLDDVSINRSLDQSLLTFCLGVTLLLVSFAMNRRWRMRARIA
jgi:hypothetical protein